MTIPPPDRPPLWLAMHDAAAPHSNPLCKIEAMINAVSEWIGVYVDFTNAGDYPVYDTETLRRALREEAARAVRKQ